MLLEVINIAQRLYFNLSNKSRLSISSCGAANTSAHAKKGRRERRVRQSRELKKKEKTFLPPPSLSPFRSTCHERGRVTQKKRKSCSRKVFRLQPCLSVFFFCCLQQKGVFKLQEIFPPSSPAHFDFRKLTEPREEEQGVQAEHLPVPFWVMVEPALSLFRVTNDRVIAPPTPATERLQSKSPFLVLFLHNFDFEE